MLNKLWTYLYRKPTSDNDEFARKTNEEYLKSLKGRCPVRDSLVTGGDIITRSWQAEQCLQVILKSSLKDFALSKDPINTYDRVTPLFPPAGVYMENHPTLRHIPSDTSSKEVRQAYTVSINKGAGTYTIGSAIKTLTTSDEQSGPFYLPDGDVFFVQGPLLDGDFLLEEVQYPPMAYKQALELPETPIQDETLNAYSRHAIWTERLAALLLNGFLKENL